jgi:hypothetical protein
MAIQSTLSKPGTTNTVVYTVANIPAVGGGGVSGGGTSASFVTSGSGNFYECGAVNFFTSVVGNSAGVGAVSVGGSASGLATSFTSIAISGMANATGVLSSSFTISGIGGIASTNSDSLVISASGTAIMTAPSAPAEINLHANSYAELGQALFELHSLAEDQDWRIERPVYGASLQVAAVLMEKNIPSPSVFTHGPRSVVFNWAEADKNLYLTVSKSRLSVLLSSAGKIEYRTEFEGPQVADSGRFFSALEAMRLISTVE